MNKLISGVGKLVFAGLALGAAACGRYGFEERAAPAGPYTITGLGLVVATDGPAVRLCDVADGAHLDVASLMPAPGIALVADVIGEPARIRFEVNDGSYEAAAPFYSNGNSGDEAEHDPNLRVGQNLITVTALDADGTPRAVLGRELYLDVSIDTPMGIARIELIDNYDGHVLLEVTGGAAIPMGALATGTGEIDVRVTASPAIVGSVVTTLDGPVRHDFVDGWPVYTAFGPTAGFAPELGAYTITTTPYALGTADGVPGPTASVGFSIVP